MYICVRNSCFHRYFKNTRAANSPSVRLIKNQFDSRLEDARIRKMLRTEHRRVFFWLPGGREPRRWEGAVPRRNPGSSAQVRGASPALPAPSRGFWPSSVVSLAPVFQAPQERVR